MKTFRSVGLSVLLLAACSSQSGWQKPGASEGAIGEDAQACHQTARVATSPFTPQPSSAYGGTAALSAGDTRQQFEQSEFRRCMEGKGYSAQR